MPKGDYIKNALGNLDRVQFERLRKQVDAPYLAAAEDLSECYYNHWRRGLSKPWRGFDVQATERESHALFQRLHGYIWTRHEQAIDDANEALPVEERDPRVNRANPETGVTRREKRAMRLAVFGRDGIDFDIERA